MLLDFITIIWFCQQHKTQINTSVYTHFHHFAQNRFPFKHKFPQKAVEKRLILDSVLAKSPKQPQILTNCKLLKYHHKTVTLVSTDKILPKFGED